jgi:hypothetical protein
MLSWLAWASANFASYHAVIEAVTAVLEVLFDRLGLWRWGIFHVVTVVEE